MPPDSSVHLITQSLTDREKLAIGLKKLQRLPVFAVREIVDTIQYKRAELESCLLGRRLVSAVEAVLMEARGEPWDQETLQRRIVQTVAGTVDEMERE